MIVIPFFTGCQYDGDTSTLYISKDCPENITDLYVEYGYGSVSYKYSKEVQKEIEKYRSIPKKIIKVGDITKKPVRVTCSFERKPEADFKVLYRADVYYQKDKKWMHSYIPCGNSKSGCYSSKIEVKILSNEVSKLGNHFWAKRYFRTSVPVPKPKFITEPED